MKTTRTLFTAVAVSLALTAPVLADSTAMPPELSREIRAQGDAALAAMTAEGTRLDARQRAMTTLGAALEHTAPVMAERDTAAVAPCAPTRAVSDARDSAKPLSLLTISMPRLARLR